MCADGKRRSSDPRHTSIKRAMKHTVKAALVRRLERIKPVSPFLFGEEELGSRHPLHEKHESMAVRARPWGGLRGERCFLSRSLVEQSAAEWQQMLYEAAQELFGGKCQNALPAVVGVVLPAEADLSS
jgi:hypothetical protein